MMKYQYGGEDKTASHCKDWEREVEKVLKGKNISSIMTHTYEGISLKPLYTKDNINKQQRQVPVNQTATWKISQLIQAKTTDQARAKIEKAKERGQNSFYLQDVSFLQHKQDIEAILHTMNLNTDHLLFDIKNQLGFLPLLHHSLTSKQRQHITGTVGFDPFESFLINGTSNILLSTRFNYLKEAIEWGGKSAPKLRFIYMNGTIYHYAGANAIQELVYTFSNAIDTINELLNRGLSIDLIASNITFSFSIGSHYFMEIAKLRAAKQIWASIVHAFGGSKEAQKIDIHGMTSTFNKTAYDVHVNLLRATTEAFSAIIGGVNSLTIHPFDESELGERIARNIHFILKEENLLGQVRDPAGGSYYIETLTAKLAEKAWEKIKQLDGEGGFKEALVNGSIQNELAEMMKERIKDVNIGKVEVIGTNIFANLMDKAAVFEQEKNDIKLTNVTNKIANLLELLSFAEEGKSLSQLTGFLCSKNNTFSIKRLKQQTLTNHFEKLRQLAEKYRLREGHFPKVGVLVIGTLKDYKQRLDFLTNLFTAGGFELVVADMSKLERLAKMKMVILCGKDEAYSQLPIHIKDQLNVKYMYMTGKQSIELVRAHKADGCLYKGIDMYGFLNKLHVEIGGEKNEA